MTGKYLQNSAPKIKLCKQICKACGLYLNQLPALDYVKDAHIFWVGLSAVQFDDADEMLPLSPLTRSGALVSEIEAPLQEQYSFYKTNLVKCLPLNDATGKIRYPVEKEMDKCYPNFAYELEVLNPRIVFLLGKQVADFVLRKNGITTYQLPENFAYKAYKVNDTYFIPVHHPSYVLVYKRRFLDNYIKNLRKLCHKYALSNIECLA